MKPEIRRYLDEHGAEYTVEAIRKGLLETGYDSDEVDAALDEWQTERAAPKGAGEADRLAFRRWALWLHAGALVGMVVLVVLLNGTQALGLALIGAVVLGLFLALGWAVSQLVGRALLPRTGLPVALIVPAISALGLGGTCLAIMDGMTPTPPTPGSVELEIGPPLSFQGSGRADCYLHSEGGSFSIYAGNLGAIDGRTVSVSVDSYEAPTDPNAPAPAPAEQGGHSVYIALNPTSETAPPVSYGTIFDTSFEIEPSADGRSGTIIFDGLAPEPIEAPASEGTEPGDPIAGTVTWTCE